MLFIGCWCDDWQGTFMWHPSWPNVSDAMIGDNEKKINEMVNLTDEQREQIQILESFLEQGLMDMEDFGTSILNNTLQ